jgi:hypothetical protein
MTVSILCGVCANQYDDCACVGVPIGSVPVGSLVRGIRNQTFTNGYIWAHSSGIMTLVTWIDPADSHPCAWECDNPHFLPNGLEASPYTRGYWLHYTVPVVLQEKSMIGAGKVSKVSSGMKCSRCLEYNLYAEPNQSDSTYKCFSCRS